MRGARARALLVGTCVLVAPAAVRAQAPARCDEAVVAWAAGCAVGDAPVLAARCPPGHAIFVVGPGALEVDVGADTEHAFVTAGTLGASPIGEIESWDAVPAADRAAFDALVTCLRERPLALPAGVDPGRGTSRGPPSPVVPPWGGLLGLTLGVGLLVRRFGPRGLAVRAAAPLGLALATFLVRRLVVGDAYFHQNGHGPEWIAYALGRHASYGPGFEQIFGCVARIGSDPDGAVFLAQSVLGALVPAAVVAIARAARAPGPAAWALGVVVAVSPVLARIAGSESYFATEGALIVLAAAVLAVGVREDGSSTENAVAAAAAGCLVAQAALVHPVAWLAAALVPSVVVVGPGKPTTQLRLAVLATAIVAVVVAVVAGPGMLAVLSGDLGRSWLGPASEADHRTTPPHVWLALLVLIAAIAVAVRRPLARRAALAVAVLAVAVGVSWRGDLLGAAPDRVHDAYAWLYLVPWVAGLAALAAELERVSSPRAVRMRRALPIAIAVAGGGLHAASLPSVLERPTDVREAALVRAWRPHLPRGATVVYLERADRHIASIPIYGDAGVGLDVDQPPPDPTTLGRDVFVHHSSVCSAPRGRAFCDALEGAYDLEPFATAVLPAVASMEGLDYEGPEVEIGLYRVRDRRSASTTEDGSSEGRSGR